MAISKSMTVDVDALLSNKIAQLYKGLALGTSRHHASRFGLVLREWQTLLFLGRYGPMTASDLVARGSLDKAGVSRAIANVVKRKLVDVRAHPKDGRVRQLQLSRAGWAIYRDIARLAAERQQFLLSALTAEEQKSLFTILRKLQRKVDDLLEGRDGAEHSGGRARPADVLRTGLPRATSDR
jgi:DNA-binding MarR family transcriptional regulator